MMADPRPPQSQVLGFTGSRLGMTAAQKATLHALVHALRPLEVHHGDCVGADAEFHDLVRPMVSRIVGHPPLNDKLRAWKDVDEVRPPYSYYTRDRHIVQECGLLFGAPRRRQGGGTWYTLGEAEKIDRPRVVVYASGRWVARLNKGSEYAARLLQVPDGIVVP